MVRSCPVNVATSSYFYRESLSRRDSHIHRHSKQRCAVAWDMQANRFDIFLCESMRLLDLLNAVSVVIARSLQGRAVCDF